MDVVTLVMSCPSGSIYSANITGPRIKPWGAPVERGATEDEKSYDITEKDLLERYDENHRSTGPYKPTECWRREMRRAWSTLSNAVVRSSNTITTELLLSIAARMSLWTLSNADSLLCLDLKPEWKFSSMACSWRLDWSREWTSFSMNLAKKKKVGYRAGWTG